MTVVKKLSPTEITLGVAVLAVYLLAFLAVGSISHRIRFIGTHARVRSGFAWARNYYMLLVCVVAVSVVLFLLVQVGVNLDLCMEDSLHVYTNRSVLAAWKSSKLFAALVVVGVCLQLVFVRRVGSRRERQGTPFSLHINWEAVCRICLFHIGCRTTYFVCVFFKQLLNDSTCRPVGTQANSISFDAQYASFWLLTLVRLPVGLTSATPDSLGSYSLATYVVRACQGYVSSSEMLFLSTSVAFLVSQLIVVLFFDFGQGLHTLRQIVYGFFLGIMGHGVTSFNIDTLFTNAPAANMPAPRRVRIRRLVVPITNSMLGYVVCGALGIRILTLPGKAHTYLMWKEILAVGPLVTDVGVALVFIFSIVRKGARRQGYVRYDAVLPDDDELEAGN